MDRACSYFEKWRLSESRLLVETDTSRIYKVSFEGQAAILKLLTDVGRKFEGGSSEVLYYFNGAGSVNLLKADEGALLLEYLEGPTLEELSIYGRDQEAVEVICQVVEKLHSPKISAPKNLKSLSELFQSLHDKAREKNCDPVFIEASHCANELLAREEKTVVLHGDLHHQNILKSNARGWLAIDPQAVLGDQAYDLANNFYNPRQPTTLAENTDRIKMYAKIFSERLRLDPQRILKFAFAAGCLSACWYLEDGKNPERRIRVAKLIQSLI